MKRIIITGGGGYLAGHLFEHLAARGGYELALINRSPRAGREMRIADLAEWSADWTDSFAEVHAVVHLAACHTPGASWSDLQRDNIQATLNVFEAAVRGKARRVIFASSSRVLEGYFDSRVRMTPALPPRPVSPYGTSKAAGEAIARYFAMQRGLSVVCFRAGRCHEGDERRSAGLTLSQQSRRLSRRDFCQAMELAIEAEGVGFSLLHLASEVAGSCWDISDTKQLLGYAPRDHYRLYPPSPGDRVIRALKRRVRRLRGG